MRIESAPAADRYCKRCGQKTSFVSSGLFRVNANHHVLDVWLIHRCAVCDATWKMQLHERVSPRALPAKLLAGYHNNDAGLAWRAAYDPTLLEKNHVAAQYDRVPLEIQGPEVCLARLDEPVAVTMTCAHGLPVRAARILRQKLSVSGTSYTKLVDAGHLASPGADLKRVKFVSGMEVFIR